MQIHKIGAISRTYRHFKRYRQVLTILFKYGFGDLAERLRVAQYLEIGLQMISRRRRERVAKLTRSERIRMVLEELGPTFIKLGQVLSTRPDLIPPEFAQELAKLQDQAAPFPFAQVKEIIEAELKAPLEEKFDHFEETPLAAASIGQVHRARLQNGEEVVVKVQRPGMRDMIEADLEILLHLATLAERHVEEWGIQRPSRIVEEFARTLEKEIDYTVEATHIERFARQFLGNATVYVPRIYHEAITERVLTMEYIPGIKASEVALLDRQGFDRKIIAARGADLILEQVFHHGFFHADPHPGNVFLLPGNVVCYLDFGMMGSVDRQAREDFADLVSGYVRRSESKVVQALLRIVEWDKEPDRRALERDIADFMGAYLYKPLKELRIGVLLTKLLRLVTRHRLRFPPDIFLMIKAMSTVEGVGVLLDPDFEMIEKAAPFIERVKKERLNPERIFWEILETGSDLVQLFKEGPGEMRDIFRQMRQGKVKIVFEHLGLEHFAFHIDRSSNRLAFALIISSLIIGSSLILRTHIGPFLFGLPVLGLFGFTIAGVLGIGLLISIIRSGRL